MDFKHYVWSFLGVFLVGNISFAQTIEQREKVTKNYNSDYITKLSAQFNIENKRQQDHAFEYAAKNDLPLVKEDEKGNKSYLTRMDENGILVYLKHHGTEAIETIKASSFYQGGSLGIEVTGEGYTAGVWDGGTILADHELLAGKVTNKDDSSADDHATHVGGIIAGKKMSSGDGADAQGVAYEADLISYDWYNDTEDMIDEAADGLLVSNHSYGIDIDEAIAQIGEDYIGSYDNTSYNMDLIAATAPYYQIVNASGNDGGWSGQHELLGSQMSTAKNVLVVGSVDYVANYNGPNSVTVSSFSSGGPTNDLRIKPDILAQGNNVYSSTAASTSSYAAYPGTSMAAPGISGGIVLMQDLSNELNDEYLKSATVRAIISHTARQVNDEGPDAISGWGLMDLEGIGELMIENYEKQTTYYREKTLQNGDEYTKTVKANGAEDLKVTVAWTDAPGDSQLTGYMNPEITDDPVLINDLDVRVIDSEGNKFYPWRLTSVENAAQNDADNDVDNIEQVVVELPNEGEEYTVEITHKGELTNNGVAELPEGEQEYSIVVSGIDKELGNDGHELADVALYPNPAVDQFNLLVGETGQEVGMVIYDLNGRQVMSRKYAGETHFSKSVYVSGLSKGVYIVKVETEGKKTTKKLILK